MFAGCLAIPKKVWILKNKYKSVLLNLKLGITGEINFMSKYAFLYNIWIKGFLVTTTFFLKQLAQVSWQYEENR